ncbi:MAG: aminopeptidase [Lentisphaerae bacterium]|nr:aminopeptidase [Lentisphaerota bacterium]
MADIRVERHARLLVRYCLNARRRQTVAVNGGAAAEPLLTAVYAELLKRGAYPVLRMVPERVDDLLFAYGKPHHFSEITEYQRAFVRTVDASLSVLASANTRGLSGADPQKQAALAKAQRPLRNVLQKKPWTLTLFPTAAYAQDAEMSLREFEDFVYGAVFADEPDPVEAWRDLGRRQKRMIARLRGADRIRIVGAGTDLAFSVKGRRFINSDGRHNMPSGEIFTTPLEKSAEGHIRYDFPVCHAGREIAGIRLVFRKGRVVEATAEKNEAFLRSMLDVDPGARRLGELGIGTNRRIQRFTRNILFDEKIGGTVHLALGKAYPETGGRNTSALHWDMIKDLRRDGALYVDGKRFRIAL